MSTDVNVIFVFYFFIPFVLLSTFTFYKIYSISLYFYGKVYYVAITKVPVHLKAQFKCIFLIVFYTCSLLFLKEHNL